ncbi:MAG: PBP1A family penicillin-binding protein [Patescibacteria group bacterium]
MFFRRGRSRLRSRFNNYQQMSPGQKRILRLKILRWVAVVLFLAVLAGIVAFFALFAYYSKDLPKPGQVVRRAGFSTKIYDRNGVLLYDLFNEERRNPVSYGQLPENLKNAVVAIEDKDFYKHGGFDFMTIVRIPYNIIFRHRVVGGSTLTQQLVKNVFLSNEKTFSRKFKELVISIQIERTFTKEQILEMYLNEAPYGGTAWGIGTAAEIYFNKSVSDLNLVESAFLAGLPQRPSAYSPYSGKKDAEGEPLWKMRTRGVLMRMKEDGYITDLAYEEAMGQVETLTFEKTAVEIKSPHFVFYVKDQLSEMFGEDLVEKGGLSVTTTLDLELQQQAQQIVAEEIEAVEKYKISNGSAMVLNPETGEIISMVGSKDYFAEDIDGQYNVAVDGLRQPGSSIKPVTYLAMIRMGYTPATMLADVPTTFAPHDDADKYEPKNYDGKFRGPVNLRNSLGSSLNIPAVKSLAIVGVPNFLQLANDMGFKTLEPTEANLKRFGLAVTLGGAEVHLIDTVSAYSSFANGGLKVEPVSILKVTDSEGNLLYEHKPVAGARVFSEEEAFLINHILSDNNARLLAFGANSLLNTGKPIAVKTGTTNDQRDNWTIGWSQKVMVGVWVGNNDNSEMSRVASGVTGASPIWRKIIMAALEKGYEAPEWKVPEGVEEVEVDSISGYLKHDEFPSRKDYVIKGTLPPPPDPIHIKAKVCRGENKLANEARVAAGDFEEKEIIVMQENDPVSTDGKNRWQEGIMNWINSQDDGRFKYPTEYCGESGDVTVRLSRPENEKVYSEEDIEVHIDAGSDEGIEKIELWIDGSLREIVNSYSYRGKVHLSSGQHELYAKAKSRNGKEATSNTVKIGTGGQDWKKPEPTATPVPTAVPTVAPTVAPTAAPTAVPPSPTPAPPSPTVTPIPTGAPGT